MSERSVTAKNFRRAHAHRISWALKQSGGDLSPALLRDRSPEAASIRNFPQAQQIERLIRLILERADPTSNKQFTPWLVREYAAGRLILEDLGTANETLTLFQRYAPRLKAEQRDIQRYGSLAAAWEAVRGFAEREEAHSNKAQKALDRTKAYEESQILRQDADGFTVAVPLTEFASKWWGRGTRWCTAAEKNNAFEYYNKQAPLIVMLIPGHGKFQLWLTASDFQFMDAADKAVSLELSKKFWQLLGPLLGASLKQNGAVLEFIPLERRTYDHCLTVVKQDGMALRWVPEQHRTGELCLEAVQQTGKALQLVLEEHRTVELCLTAVRQAGWALHWVPEEHLTQAVCLAAVKQNGSALRLVPRKHKTPDLCMVAVQQTGQALLWVPEEHRTAKLCRTAVRQSGWALHWVPKEHRTQAVCLAAVKQSGGALEWVPEELRTPELCLAAVQQAGWALNWVPEEHRTYDLCLAAVQQSGLALERVPKRHRSAEICLTAVRQMGCALLWVPQEHLTQDLCLAAVQQDGRALKWVPEEHLTRNLCLAAVEQDGRALKWVPSDLRTQEIYLAALSKDRTAMEFIPAHVHAELLKQLPPEPAPTIEWSVALLDTWTEKLKQDTAPGVEPYA